MSKLSTLRALSAPAGARSAAEGALARKFFFDDTGDAMAAGDQLRNCGRPSSAGPAVDFYQDVVEHYLILITFSNMKPPAVEYRAPSSVSETLQVLSRFSDSAKLLAGGQSLMPALNFRLASPELLIDLNRVAELQQVVVRDDGALAVGSMTRHRLFELDPRVAAGWPLLRAAVESIAHVQIRNRGTIGGSLCHADPSAEWPALALACDATMVIAGPRGTRRCAAHEFLQGLFTTAVQPDELLVQVVFPRWPGGRRWGFEEVARRRGDFAIAGIACTLDFEADVCRQARIVAFGATDRAERVGAVEDALIGRRCTPADIEQAATRASGALEARADHHASAEYRSHLVGVLARRALQQAVARKGSFA